PVTNMMPMSD
ncbi:hypothetical protein D039_0595B, partial [Vibrio parahaemolyticus EKP-028]